MSFLLTISLLKLDEEVEAHKKIGGNCLRNGKQYARGDLLH